MGEMGCGSKTMKVILIIFNLIFFICGAVILGFGIWILVNPVSLEDMATKVAERAGKAGILPDLPEEVLSSVGYTAVVFGGVMFLIAFCGCFGAWKEIRVLLIIYALFLMIIFIALLAIAITLLVAKSKLRDLYAPGLKKKLAEKYLGPKADPSNEFTLGWDAVQVEFMCCGVEDFHDFDDAANWEKTPGQLVPETCCQISAKERQDFLDGVINTITEAICTTAPNSDNSYVDQPCASKLEEELTPKLDSANLMAVSVTSVTIIILVLLLLGIVFACCLASSVARSGVNEV